MSTKTSDQISPANTNTKFMIMVLLGGYIRSRGGAIWLSDLLYLLELLGVGNRTARSTISRMAQEGWFDIQKDGRHSRYVITPYGMTILQGADLRIDEKPLVTWNGTWHMVAYSLPENKRKLRNNLRKQLAWLGFGQLGPGLWISPHNRLTELNRILVELQVQDYVNLFSGTYWGPLTKTQLVQQCWDLPGLEQEYQQFLAQHEPQYDATKATIRNGISPIHGFQQRFWLTIEFFPFLQKDPNLPTVLLPQDWVGLQAKQLFADFRQLLEPVVNPFVDAVVSGNRPNVVD